MRQTRYLSWDFELDFRVGLSSWTFELDFRVGRSSWTFELDFRVGFSSWTFELDFRVGFSSLDLELDSPAGSLGWCNCGFGHPPPPPIFFYIENSESGDILGNVCCFSYPNKYAKLWYTSWEPVKTLPSLNALIFGSKSAMPENVHILVSFNA